MQTRDGDANAGRRCKRETAMQTRDGDANAGRRCKRGTAMQTQKRGGGQREHNLIRECVCSVDFPTEKVSDLQESQFGETKLEKIKDFCTEVLKSKK